jgi:hypothetical protein
MFEIGTAPAAERPPILHRLAVFVLDWTIDRLDRWATRGSNISWPLGAVTSELPEPVALDLHPALKELGYSPRVAGEPFAIAVNRDGIVVEGLEATEALFEVPAATIEEHAILTPNEPPTNSAASA